MTRLKSNYCYDTVDKKILKCWQQIINRSINSNIKHKILTLHSTTHFCGLTHTHLHTNNSGKLVTLRLCFNGDLITI